MKYLPFLCFIPQQKTPHRLQKINTESLPNSFSLLLECGSQASAGQRHPPTHPPTHCAVPGRRVRQRLTGTHPHTRCYRHDTAPIANLEALKRIKQIPSAAKCWQVLRTASLMSLSWSAQCQAAEARPLTELLTDLYAWNGVLVSTATHLESSSRSMPTDCSARWLFLLFSVVCSTESHSLCACRLRCSPCVPSYRRRRI
jgi:hypothetical protein